MTDRIRTRFLIIGSGVAGLHTAWRASQTDDVLAATKRSLFDSATAYPQGGIAAALGAGDSPELHRKDTLAAGAALCDAAAVQVLVEEGPTRVRELQTAGARFDLGADGKLKLGKEAAHSRRRIVHAQGDQPGAEGARALSVRAREGDRRGIVSACAKRRACSTSSSIAAAAAVCARVWLVARSRSLRTPLSW